MHCGCNCLTSVSLTESICQVTYCVRAALAKKLNFRLRTKNLFDSHFTQLNVILFTSRHLSIILGYFWESKKFIVKIVGIFLRQYSRQKLRLEKVTKIQKGSKMYFLISSIISFCGNLGSCFIKFVSRMYLLTSQSNYLECFVKILWMKWFYSGIFLSN